MSSINQLVFTIPPSTLGLCVFLMLVAAPMRGLSDESDENLPTELRVMLQEAEEAFFDGDYAHARRLAEDSRAWVNKANNQKMLAKRQQDHTLLEGFVNLLSAQIDEHAGDLGRAKRSIDKAEAIFQDRRVKNNVRREFLWLAEANLNLLRGDLEQASPVFLAESEGLKISNELLRRFEECGADLEEIVGKLQNNKLATTHYREAERILEEHIFKERNRNGQMFGRGAGVGYYDYAERMRRRVLVANARQRLMDSDKKLSDRIKDSEAYVHRAEDELEGTSWWRSFVELPGGLPKTYLEFEESVGRGGMGFAGGFALYQGAAETLAGAAAGVGNRSTRLNQVQMLDIKREWAHKYGDWLEVALARAELESLRLGVAGVDLKDDEATMPDDIYQSATAMLSTQFSHKHPLVLKVLLSRLRWAMSRLVFRAAKVTEQNAVGFLSECRDCLFQSSLLRAWDVNASDRRLVEYYVIELRALDVIWRSRNLQTLLKNEDRLEILRRVEQIGNEIIELDF